MFEAKRIGLVAALAAAVTAPNAGASGLTWFGETTFTGAYPAGSEAYLERQPGLPQDVGSYLPTSDASYFGSNLSAEDVLVPTDLDQGQTRLLRSEVGLSFASNDFSVPLYYRKSLYTDGRQQQMNAFGFKWRHRFERAGSLTVSARYGSAAYTVTDDTLQDTASKLAAVSWTSAWAETNRGSITGSVFFGDEQPKDAAYEELGRRIYGLAVGGQWTLSKRHTPYVSLRYQTSDQAQQSLFFDDENYTRLSAGWSWQVRSNWSVRAEANFTYNQPTWDLFSFDRTRIFFGTRFDIK